MKRIICTVTNDLSYDQRMIRICSALVEHGYQVTLVGRQLPSSIDLAQSPYRQKRLRLFFIRGKLFYLEYNLRLFFLLLFARFDVVCSVDLDTLLPGFLVAKLRNKICVYDAHEYFTEVPELIDRPWVKKTWEGLAAWIIPRLHFAFTVCESLSEVFYEKYDTRFAVIRNLPYRQAEFHRACAPTSMPSKWVLLYQGNLNEGRGLEELIDAMAFIGNAELWLAGEGDLSQQLRNLTSRLQLNDRIRFLGKIPPADLPALTAKAHIGFNLLSNKGLNYYYSLANKALDYIQTGIPSINMDFPEYRRLNEQYGVFLLLKKLERQEIVETVQRLQHDENLYIELQKNCLVAREELVWENEVPWLIEFFHRIGKSAQESAQ